MTCLLIELLVGSVGTPRFLDLVQCVFICGIVWKTKCTAEIVIHCINFEKVFGKKYTGFPQQRCIVSLYCSACSQPRREYFQRHLRIRKFVSKLFLCVCVVFAMAWFTEKEPGLPKARQCARQSKKRIPIL